MYLECHATVGETCFDGEEHRRYIQGIRCEVVCSIGVGALTGMILECEPFEEGDSVYTYAEYLV